MRKWSIAFGAAMLSLSLAAPTHADEWNKLTYLTFSGPVQMPGVTLPAGTYRFELADPDSSRRVVRVSNRDGSQNYGIFLSISDQKLEPAKDPLVMFKETPAGAPPAVQAWFYPGETYGYEFVYPHDQALKLARANHGSVLAMKETPKSTTEAERKATMTNADVTRIDENDKTAPSDERLKNSSSRRPSTATTTAGAATAQPNTTAQSTTSPAVPNQSRTTATSGTQARAATATAGSRSARSLPRTAGELPLYELLSALALAGGLGIRAFCR